MDYFLSRLRRKNCSKNTPLEFMPDNAPPFSTANHNSKALVFIHLPRTGGSNLWHSTIHAFRETAPHIQMVDIFHETITRYDSILYAGNTAIDLKLKTEMPTPSFIHHHTSYGIWRELGDNAQYFTLLRDPIDRAISHYFHSLRLYYDMSDDLTEYYLRPDAHTRFGDKWHGDDALDTFIPLSEKYNLLSPEAICAFIAEHPSLTRNFYCEFMCRYFGIADEASLRHTPPFHIKKKTVSQIARLMKQHFRDILFSVEEAFACIEGHFSHPIKQKNQMRNAIAKPALDDMVTLKQSLKPYFMWDYALMKALQPAPKKSLIAKLKLHSLYSHTGATLAAAFPWELSESILSMA